MSHPWWASMCYRPAVRTRLGTRPRTRTFPAAQYGTTISTWMDDPRFGSLAPQLFPAEKSGRETRRTPLRGWIGHRRSADESCADGFRPRAHGGGPGVVEREREYVFRSESLHTVPSKHEPRG